MIYIFRRAASTGARSLANVLEGKRVLRSRSLNGAGPNDVVICWGDNPEQPIAARTINNAPVLNKFTELTRLKEAGVPTVEFGATPGATGEWLGRTRNHTGGADLLNAPVRPAYFVRKDEFVREVRVHSFDGKSIRAGVKTLRDGFSLTPQDQQQRAHPWIRSWDGGWRISYKQDGVRQKHRDVAHAAVKALGLTFGAVDIGERADGSVVVLEVNRAPGLDGTTPDRYAMAIKRYLEATP